MKNKIVKVKKVILILMKIQIIANLKKNKNNKLIVLQINKQEIKKKN